MRALLFVPAFDDLEDRHPDFGLGLEPKSIHQLAFERGEVALGHGVVLCVTDRAHRRLNVPLTAVQAQRDIRVLRAPVAIVGHRAWASLRQRHVQGLQDQFGP